MNVAMNDNGHEVTLIMPKPSHAEKLEQNVLLCNEINVYKQRF